MSEISFMTLDCLAWSVEGVTSSEASNRDFTASKMRASIFLLMMCVKQPSNMTLPRAPLWMMSTSSVSTDSQAPAYATT